MLPTLSLQRHVERKLKVSVFTFDMRKMTAEKSSEREKDYLARRMNINEDEKRSEEDIE